MMRRVLSGVEWEELCMRAESSLVFDDVDEFQKVKRV